MRKVEIFIKWTAMTRTTDARVALGRLPKTPVSHSSTGTVIPARTSIAIWVWVPDLSETAVLVGEPSTPKEDPRPFTMFATPRPVRSRFGSCVSSCWMAPETDEGAAAHVWQLLMVGQVPFGVFCRQVAASRPQPCIARAGPSSRRGTRRDIPGLVVRVVGQATPIRHLNAA